jgi:trk system potassium uptake protein TrkH
MDLTIIGGYMTRAKTLLKLSSSLLFILSVLLLIPLVIAWYYQETSTVYHSFVIAAAISAGLAILFRIITRKHTAQLDLATSMILCTVSWVVLSLLGAVPFMIGLNKTFIDALFEAVSGFTTTGITVFQGLDSMSPAILFWRSLIQWLGGLGILTFFLFVTANSEGNLWNLFSAEGHKISSARPVPNVYRTISFFWMIYGAYTVIETIMLKLLGLSFFDAIIHSLTTLSTGGFSNHDASIAYYQQTGYGNYRLIEYTIIFFMFLGGVNFLIHYKMILEDRRAFFKDAEAKVYTGIILVFSGITLFGIWMLRGIGSSNIEESIRKVLFQIVSVMTTTGFGTEDIGSEFFPAVTKQLFIILMIVGGCVGSTAGGVKVLRVVILQKLLKREVNKLTLSSHAILPVTVDKQVVKNDEILRVTSIIFGWILLIAVGSGITALFTDLGPFESFSGMTSAVGNIGPFYFSVDKMASLSWVVKLTYIIGMLAGRLELLPIYILLSKKAWK